MENVIKRSGRLTLIQSEEGFCWRLQTLGGRRWHWHPQARQWTATCQWCATEAEATAELDWTLQHEDAGDLDEQHRQGSR